LYGCFGDPIDDTTFVRLFDDNRISLVDYTVFFRDFYIDYRWKQEDGYVVAILYCEDGKNKINFQFDVVLYDENPVPTPEIIERFELNKDLATVKKVLQV
jgi:hypothetical protein